MLLLYKKQFFNPNQWKTELFCNIIFLSCNLSSQIIIIKFFNWMIYYSRYTLNFFDNEIFKNEISFVIINDFNSSIRIFADQLQKTLQKF